MNKAAPAGVAAPAARKPDVGSGETVFNDVCAECHETEELTGADLESFRTNLVPIAAGKKKHKPKLRLAPSQTDDLVAWLATLK